MAIISLTKEEDKRREELMKILTFHEKKVEQAKKELRAIIYKIEKL